MHTSSSRCHYGGTSPAVGPADGSIRLLLWQAKAYSTDRLSKLSLADLKSLDAATLGMFSREQMACLSVEAIAALSAEQLSKLTPEQVSS